MQAKNKGTRIKRCQGVFLIFNKRCTYHQSRGISHSLTATEQDTVGFSV